MFQFSVLGEREGGGRGWGRERGRGRGRERGERDREGEGDKETECTGVNRVQREMVKFHEKINYSESILYQIRTNI